ncbi:MAG: carbohydrate ABC transporter permease [Oscillospiraceae bacterium]|nr:carbohydrate ABC transporter permease [Oscillospiraceae bacterium]
MKVSRSRRVFLVLNALFVLLVCLAIALPIWMVVVTSFSSNEVAATEGFVFIPKGFHLDSYQAVFSSSGYMGAFIRSIGVTIASTALSMALTTTMAYALAQKDLVFRNFFMNAVLLTMVVDGGIIPFYMVIRQMGMIDTYAALIIPMAITTYNLILMRNFFGSLPESLMESARLDGCNELGILCRIVLPVSVPILAAILLFYAVGHWNRYFEVIMFINSSKKYTLQVLLRQLIFQSEGEGTFSVQVNNFKMA